MLTLITEFPQNLIANYDPTKPLEVSNQEKIMSGQARLIQERTELRVDGLPAEWQTSMGVGENGQNQNGTLLISTDQLYWLNQSTGSGFAMDYPSILLHALSRRDQPSIYLQVQLNQIKSQTMDGDERTTSADPSIIQDDEMGVTEMHLIPADPLAVDMMYQAISECAALHPDPEADENEPEGDWITAETLEQQSGDENPASKRAKKDEDRYDDAPIQ